MKRWRWTTGSSRLASSAPSSAAAGARAVAAKCAAKTGAFSRLSTAHTCTPACGPSSVPSASRDRPVGAGPIQWPTRTCVMSSRVPVRLSSLHALHTPPLHSTPQTEPDFCVLRDPQCTQPSNHLICASCGPSRVNLIRKCFDPFTSSQCALWLHVHSEVMFYGSRCCTLNPFAVEWPVNGGLYWICREWYRMSLCHFIVQ